MDILFDSWKWLLALPVVISLLLWLFRKAPPNDYPYEAQGDLFTPAEKHFLTTLTQAIDSKHHLIFGKTRLADIIKTCEGMASGERQVAFNKISSKHLDFVICATESLNIIGVIELDDSSHQRADRKARDIFVDGALAAAGVPILHVPVRREYSVQDIKSQLKTHLNL